MKIENVSFYGYLYVLCKGQVCAHNGSRVKDRLVQEWGQAARQALQLSAY